MSARIRKVLAARSRVLEGALRGVRGGVLVRPARRPGSPQPVAVCGAADLPRSPRHTNADH